MRKLIGSLLITVALSAPAAGQASTCPYTLHSASQAYLGTLERTCDPDRAERAGQRQVDVARRSDEKSAALRSFIGSGRTLGEHVAESYPVRLAEVQAACAKRVD